MVKPGLVRFVLASLVVLFHITKFVFIGELAVFCFFILSGYWVTLMYEKKYSKKKNALYVFYLSRILRLAPVYYLISFFTFIFVYLYTPEKLLFLRNFDLDTICFWLSNLFIIGYNYLPFQPLGPAWSLDIEVQFYFLLPLILGFMHSKINRMFILIISLFVSVSLFVFFADMFISKTIIKYLVYFLIGVTIYKSNLKFKKSTEFIFNGLFLVILIIHYAIPELFDLVKSASNEYNNWFNIIVSFLLIPLLTNSVLVKSNPKDMFLGGVSYTLYLTHWMFIIPYEYYITGMIKVERIPYTVLYLFVTYLFSFFIFKYFDNPIDKLRKRWVDNLK